MFCHRVGGSGRGRWQRHRHRSACGRLGWPHGRRRAPGPLPGCPGRGPADSTRARRADRPRLCHQPGAGPAARPEHRAPATAGAARAHCPHPLGHTRRPRHLAPRLAHGRGRCAAAARCGAGPGKPQTGAHRRGRHPDRTRHRARHQRPGGELVTSQALAPEPERRRQRQRQQRQIPRQRHTELRPRAHAQRFAVRHLVARPGRWRRRLARHPWRHGPLQRAGGLLAGGGERQPQSLLSDGGRRHPRLCVQRCEPQPGHQAHPPVSPRRGQQEQLEHQGLCPAVGKLHRRHRSRGAAPPRGRL